VEVAPLDPEALEDLRPLALALAAHVRGLDIGVGPVRPDDEFWARLAPGLAGAQVLVARDGGAAVGAAVVRLGSAWGTRASTDPTVDIELLAVLPEARGRGVGHALLEALRAAHPGADATLGVPTVNVGARRFYAREGFRPFTSRWFAPLAGERPAGGPAVTALDPADVDRLRPLHRSLCERHDAIGPGYLPARLAPDAVWELERGEHLLPGRFLLHAGDDGYALASVRDPGFTLWDTGPVGHVEVLVVRDGARGGGVGAALLHATERELGARGARALDLDVLEGNEAAQRFYARQGLRRVVEGLYARL
jgi:ribosomal protein S18 acetylase RimI-like enzyme